MWVLLGLCLAVSCDKFVPADAPAQWRFPATAHLHVKHDSLTAFKMAEFPQQRTKGVLYSAVGETSLREAAVSALSLRRAVSFCNASIVTDARGSEWLRQRAHVRSLFELVLVTDFVDQTWGFRFTKINALLMTPYDNTVFLDADTFFCRHGDHYMHAQLNRLFHVLDRFDFAAVHGTFVPDVTVGRPADTDVNSGVTLFRKTPAMFELVANWRKELMREIAKKGPIGAKDQGPLMQAIRDTTSLALWVLPPEFNCRGARLCDREYTEFTSPFVRCLISHTHLHAATPVWVRWVDEGGEPPFQ